MCVFWNTRGYREHDLRDGTTFYDRSKALGEIDDKKNLTIRSSIVEPDTNPAGIGLMNWFMQQSGEIYGYTRVYWTGQTTLQYAKTVEAAVKAGVHGIYIILFLIQAFPSMTCCSCLTNIYVATE